MNDFFKFDDKRIMTSISFIISIVLFILLFVTFKEIEIFILLFLTFMVTLIGAFFLLNEGIHFNYKKEKIIIVKGMSIKKINMPDIRYFNIEEISKRKGNIIRRFFDTTDQINLPSNYVYNKGKVYNIVFHTIDGKTIKIYYGWLYKTNSIDRIVKQLEKFKKVKEKFIKYKKFK